MIDHELLSIYLNDHLAGAAAGCQRMARLADAEKDAPDGGALAGVAREIEEDRLTLQRVVAEAAVERNALKEGLGWLAEKVGLLKLNGRWWRRSPLTSLLELEAMRMGVTGKLALWTSLENTSLAGSFDFGALVARARRQLEVLEEAHRQRAHASLDQVLV